MITSEVPPYFKTRLPFMVEPLNRPNATNMTHNHNRFKEAQIGISVLQRLFLAQLDLLNMSINN